MAAVNQTYLVVYDILENIAILEAKLQSTLEDLERNEESWRRMEAAEASQAEEFAKIKTENKELNRKLQESQASFRTLQNDFATVNGKVFGLKMKVKAAE